jgi:hypothetical protein
MIAIINRGQISNALHHYEIKINQETITTFEHDRKKGLAQCLRDAADAVDAARRADFICAYKKPLVEADNGI